MIHSLANCRVQYSISNICIIYFKIYVEEVNMVTLEEEIINVNTHSQTAVYGICLVNCNAPVYNFV